MYQVFNGLDHVANETSTNRRFAVRRATETLISRRSPTSRVYFIKSGKETATTVSKGRITTGRNMSLSSSIVAATVLVATTDWYTRSSSHV